jgi:hypothetical protein
MLKKLMLKASDVASLQPRDLTVGLGRKGAVVVEVAGYRNGVMVGMMARGGE